MIPSKVINLIAALGVLIGAMGFVRTGSMIVGGALTLTGFRQERRIERYLPFLIGVALVIVAIVLPHGRQNSLDIKIYLKEYKWPEK